MKRPSAKNLTSCLLVLTALIACPPPAHGRVFQRIAGAGTTAKRLESVGATQAYQSRVTVNGVGADLTVLSFDAPAADATPRIRSALGTNFALQAGALSTASATEGDRPVHVLVSGVDASRTLVFVMLLDRRPDASAPLPWPLSAVPLMPGGSTVFAFENASTHTRFAIARTPDTPEAAVMFCERHLKSRGWEVQGLTQASLSVYSRKQDLCVVMVQPPGKPGEDTRIAILEKRLGGP
jgi:hypothetical protein